MKVELASPTVLPALANREPAAKKIQAEVIKKNALVGPAKKSDVDETRGTEKKIELRPGQTQLRFETDKDTGIQLIKIIDAESGEVMLQFPPEELLNITKSLNHLKGLFVSKES